MKLRRVHVVLAATATALALISCSSTVSADAPGDESEPTSPASEAAPPAAEPAPPAAWSTSVPCSFLTEAELAEGTQWDPAGTWSAADAESGMACVWTNFEAEYRLTVHVLSNRAAVLGSIPDRTEEVMVAYTATQGVRDDVGLLEAVYPIAGRDYIVKLSQEPALLDDDKFTALAATAALAFENSPLNVG